MLEKERFECSFRPKVHGIGQLFHRQRIDSEKVTHEYNLKSKAVKKQNKTKLAIVFEPIVCALVYSFDALVESAHTRDRPDIIGDGDERRSS